MRHVGGRSRRRSFQVGIRALMGMVLLSALGMWGTLELLVLPYRRGWEAEQRALAAIRRDGGRISVGYRAIGPKWLRAWAGESRSRDFQRGHVPEFHRLG